MGDTINAVLLSFDQGWLWQICLQYDSGLRDINNIYQLVSSAPPW